MSIAAAVLEAVRTETARRPGAHATRIGVRVGEVSGIEPESLRFCFETLVAGTDLAPLALDLELIARRNHCHVCGTTFAVVDYNFICPACGASDTRPAGGDEIDLSYVELEEP